WNEYYAAFKTTYPLTDSQLKTADSKLNTARGLCAQSLPGKQAIPTSVLISQAASNGWNAYPAMLATREGLVKLENEPVTRYLSAALTDDQAKGAPPTVKAEPSPFLKWIDLLTIWGLMVMGAGLLLGVLTRTNCLLAAGFLLLTYVCSPPFPWLTPPPN